MPEMVPLAECENRRLYEINSRNLTVGAFRAATGGFIGIREKFGSRYLFEEYHYERDPRLGTVRPVAALNAYVPPEIQLDEYLTGPDDERIKCAVCGRWAVQYRGTFIPNSPSGPPFYRHADEPEGQDVCRRDGEEYGRAYLVPNTELFELMKAYTPWAQDVLRT